MRQSSGIYDSFSYYMNDAIKQTGTTTQAQLIYVIETEDKTTIVATQTKNKETDNILAVGTRQNHCGDGNLDLLNFGAPTRPCTPEERSQAQAFVEKIRTLPSQESFEATQTIYTGKLKNYNAQLTVKKQTVIQRQLTRNADATKLELLLNKNSGIIQEIVIVDGEYEEYTTIRNIDVIKGTVADRRCSTDPRQGQTCTIKELEVVNQLYNKAWAKVSQVDKK